MTKEEVVNMVETWLYENIRHKDGRIEDYITIK